MLGHPPYAERQGDGDNGGKPLGYGGHRQGHAAQDGRSKGVATQHADGDHQRNSDAGDDRQAFAQPLELLLQRGQPGLIGRDHARQTSELGRHAGLGDQQLGGAAHHRRVHVSDVGPVGQGDLALAGGQRGLVLVDRFRLAGQGALVHRQRVRLHEAAVRGNPVARLEQNQVPGHHVGGGDLLDRAVPAHLGLRGQHARQRFHRLVGPLFLNEAEQRIDDDDHPDHDRVLQVANCGRDHRSPEQEQDEHPAKLVEQPFPPRPFRFADQLVRASLLPAPDGFGFAQAASDVDVEFVGRFGGIEAVPG